MPELTSLSDIQEIANTEAQRSQKFLLGVTKSPPRYERVPAPIEEDPNAVFEFVVDCYILQSATQAIVLGEGGLRVIEDILVSADATGDLLADIHVPVEIRKNATGQLEVVGRAKVALPALRLDEYDAFDLGIHHILELDYDETDNVWRDAFGIICDVRSGTSGLVLGDSPVLISAHTTVSTALSTLTLLGYDDLGTMPGAFGSHILQRVIVTTSSDVEARSNSTMSITEATSTV